MSKPKKLTYKLTLDFKQLKVQKKALVTLMEQTDNLHLRAELEGIISILDAVQDQAVDELGYSEKEVFDLHAL